MPAESVLKEAWNRLLESIRQNISQETQRVEQAMSFARLRDQLWVALDNSENAAAGWAYPIDVFVGDDGVSLFSIVAQNGKLYQVPMTVSGEELTLGEWVQVTEVFQPVSQNSFTVTRQKDGTYRWLSIAATTVLNRVGEMDSAELFDSFIAHAEQTGKYPRLDFYHLGGTDPELWEFGTADYLARDGVCYIASGTFDEDHPLAQAFIQTSKNGSDEWGNSIEFYAYTEPEIIVLEPKIQIPVYRQGENIRISLVLEKDAACLFTRMVGFNEEKKRTMDPRVEAALKKLLGDDEEALEKFIESVDTVNQTVKNERLIHRQNNSAEGEETEEDVAEESDEEEQQEEVAQSTLLELDDESLAHLAQQLTNSEAFANITQSLDKLAEAVAQLVIDRESDNKEIIQLKKANAKLNKQVQALSADETVKKQTWAQDLPARRTLQVTYRRRDQDDAIEDDEELNDSEAIAQKTLAKLPSY